MNEHYEFKNVPLPYGFDGLEPYIDERTMILHHDRHLQTYINNLNGILKNYPKLQTWPLENLICFSSSLPPEIRVPIEQNAGGVYNHFFYFAGMDIPRRGAPSGCLGEMIVKKYGTFDAFKSQFKNQAMGVFGSGYAWLTINRFLKLDIIPTKNQMTPLTENLYPLLTIDVWEHAYYLKHYNMRGDYVDDWFNVINWDAVEKRLDKFIQY